MPPRTDFTSRVQKYAYKLTPERVKEMFELRRTHMIDMQAISVNELGRVENEVKSVLAGFPVATVDYMKFHNFSREVYRAWMRFGGGQGLTGKVAMLIEKYKLLGCPEGILIQIRDRVFAIQAPPAPQGQGCR
jgi:hypothetical protein